MFIKYISFSTKSISFSHFTSESKAGFLIVKIMQRPFPNFVKSLLSSLSIFLLLTPILAADKIDLNQYLDRIEIADNNFTRQQGLMYRQSLPENAGMWFVWQEHTVQCMWMKNTGIPLSIAFVDRRGKIFNIYDLQPYQRRSVCSNRAAQYALEVNQGWFSKNNIRVGDVIDVRSIKK